MTLDDGWKQAQVELKDFTGWLEKAGIIAVRATHKGEVTVYLPARNAHEFQQALIERNRHVKPFSIQKEIIEDKGTHYIMKLRFVLG